MLYYLRHIFSLLGASPFVLTLSYNHIDFLHLHIPTAAGDRVFSRPAPGTTQWIQQFPLGDKAVKA
jgi:hypothetical protein